MSAETYPLIWAVYCAECVWGENHDTEEAADEAGAQHDKEQHP